MLHVICTRLQPGRLSVRVGDGSRRSEEIVIKKKSRIAPFNAIIIVVIVIIIVVVICSFHDIQTTEHSFSVYALLDHSHSGHSLSVDALS